MKEKYICIHGHFYQPPRENPWIEEVELQDSAYPFHDWNKRINEECYAPNTASRILEGDEIIDIVNNYSMISFNFGPTLLSWMDRHSPRVYAAILEADRLSMEKFSGHGSAMAQVYNHMIMPLATKRDKQTQVAWGIRDFEKRFGRYPEGMWLPETAVDTATLEILAERGIKFTVLAPRQAKRIRLLGEKKWHDVGGENVDPSMAYRCNLPSGKHIALFFYYGDISRDVAFGGLLGSGVDFAEKLLSAFSDRKEAALVNIATDGETFGHHHRHGDMALAYCLYHIEAKNSARLTNYGEFLEKHPPTHEVQIVENSSWSCVHGVGRWSEDCGCHIGHEGWTQAWRKPLRGAMDSLNAKLSEHFEKHASNYLKAPWQARDEYINVVLDRRRSDEFIGEQASHTLSDREKVTVLKLLEMQRNAMFMQTSCGWFFDEISGPETVQVMQYAAQAIHHLREVTGIDLDPAYTGDLGKAPSNVLKDGREVYETYVKPSEVDLFRVCAHYAMSSLFEEYPGTAEVYCYSVSGELYEKKAVGKTTFIMGKASLTSRIFLEEKVLIFAALHLGDQNINCGISDFSSGRRFEEVKSELREAFNRGDIPYVIRDMNKHFPLHTYTVWHIFKDGQRKILSQIMRPAFQEMEASHRLIYENNYTMMNFLRSLNMPIPKPFLVAAEFTINADLIALFEGPEMDMEVLMQLTDNVRRWSLSIDEKIGYAAGSRIKAMMQALAERRDDMALMERMTAVLAELKGMPFDLDLWETQNIYFSMAKEVHGEAKENAKWVELFNRLGQQLSVKVSL